MKKTILLIIIILAFASCKTQKLPTPEPVVINQVKSNESKEIETITKGIDDKIIIPVVEAKSNNSNFDSVVNAKVDEILNKLNYQKQSGENSFEVKYNALLKQLEVYSKIGQNTTKSKDLKSYVVKEIPVIKKVPYPVIQPLTKMQKLLIALGVGTAIFFSLKYGLKLFLYIKSKASWV